MRRLDNHSGHTHNGHPDPGQQRVAKQAQPNECWPGSWETAGHDRQKYFTDTRTVTIPGPPSLWVPPDLYTSAIELLIETVPPEAGQDFLERMLTALAQHEVDISCDGPPPEWTMYEILMDVIGELHHNGGLRGFPQRHEPDGGANG